MPQGRKISCTPKYNKVIVNWIVSEILVTLYDIEKYVSYHPNDIIPKKSLGFYG